MPDITTVLKAEISRVARKEIRSELAALKKAAASHRSEIAALKRRTQTLEQELRRAGKVVPKPEPIALSKDPKGRFSAKGLAAQRTRLGLSANDLALLVGVSSQSIYNWEEGSARPQAKHLPAIAALKSLGKKAAAEVIESRRATPSRNYADAQTP